MDCRAQRPKRATNGLSICFSPHLFLFLFSLFLPVFQIECPNHTPVGHRYCLACPKLPSLGWFGKSWCQDLLWIWHEMLSISINGSFQTCISLVCYGYIGIPDIPLLILKRNRFRSTWTVVIDLRSLFSCIGVSFCSHPWFFAFYVSMSCGANNHFIQVLSNQQVCLLATSKLQRKHYYH